jgi:hypothetical protein
MPFSVALLMIKMKYFDIESAVEQRELIKEGITDTEGTGAPLRDGRWSIKS